MKKLNLLITALSMVVATSVFAQIEVKLNPLSLINEGDVELGVEYLISDNLGAELMLSFGTRGYLVGDSTNIFETENPELFNVGAIVLGKYYFNPDIGGDGWFIGPYFKFKNGTGDSASGTNYSRSRLAGGLALGLKRVFGQGIIFEGAVGFGRGSTTFKNKDTGLEVDRLELPFFDRLDALFRLSIGYRFGDVGSSSSKSRKRR